MGRTFRVCGEIEELRKTKAFISSKITEIVKYVKSIDVECQEVTDNE